jgi:hypothetical protein
LNVDLSKQGKEGEEKSSQSKQGTTRTTTESTHRKKAGIPLPITEVHEHEKLLLIEERTGKEEIPRLAQAIHPSVSEVHLRAGTLLSVLTYAELHSLAI